MCDRNMALCPYCPGSTKLYSGSRGLQIHIGRKHKDLSNGHSAQTHLPTTSDTPLSTSGPPSTQNQLSNLAKLKKSVQVLKHVPKGARCQAAGKLSDIIDTCVRTNSVTDWYLLLSFAYTALRVPDKGDQCSLTSKVKRNIEVTTIDLPDGCSVSRPYSIYKSIQSKVYEGDLRGAVRLLVSEGSIAQPGEDTLSSLRNKHPAPSRQLCFPPPPDLDVDPMTFKAEDVVRALNTFHNGSSSGLDGIRPQHLKELSSSSAGNNGLRLIESLTRLINFLYSGRLNSEVCPFLYGASLCALTKKDGGIRPIAIGSTLRRLAAKVGCHHVREDMVAILLPHQLGFGTSQGCEAAIHATRTFVMHGTRKR